MIALVTAAAVSLVAGLLLSGCSSGNDEITSTLLNRNAALETQISTGQHIVTALAITLVIVAAGLGALLFKKGEASRGKKRNKPQTGG